MMDSEYWNRFYENFSVKRPSPFAEWVADRFELREKRNAPVIMEMGCGNGRDAIFFSSIGARVIAVDQSTVSIERLNSMSVDGATFVAGDFTDLPPCSVDYVYSRFTLHSVTEQEAEKCMRWAYDNLNENGHMCIEVRSVNDDLFGKGDEVGRDAFVTDHYRRFVRIEDLNTTLSRIGFEVTFIDESNQYAPYGDSRPYVIRALARKKK